MKLLLDNLITTGFSFYAHNGPVVFYGLGLALSLLFLILQPKRRFVLSLLAFAVLLFSFEYQKHFTAHFYSHIVLQLANPEAQFREYSLLARFFNQLFPMGLDFLGWGLLFLSLFIGIPSKKHPDMA